MKMIRWVLISSLMWLGVSRGADADGASPEEQPLPEAGAAAAAPKFKLDYSYFHYDFERSNTANTGVYLFSQTEVDLHLFIASWFFNQDWTFVAVLPHVKNFVVTDYFPGTPAEAQTVDSTEGWSDLKLLAVRLLHAGGGHVLLGDVGINLPTGSIDETFPSNPSQNASYNMQLGSGTYDVIAGATYLYNWKQLASGARAQYIYRPDENSNGWNLGNEITFKAWSRFQVNPYFSGGLQFNYKNRERVDGIDEKYELFRDIDGHQLYYDDQINWDFSALGRAQHPLPGGGLVYVEAGFPLKQGMKNMDDLNLYIDHWVEAGLSFTF